MAALAFLLQAAPPTSTMPTWLAYVGLFSLIISLIGIGFNVWSAFRKERREDGQTESQRIKRVEGRLADHDQLHTGQTQAQERLAEHVQREHQQLKESLIHRIETVERQASEVQLLRERIAGMEAKLDRIPAIDSKLDRLHEMLGQIIANK